jgi:hypothetical protein
MNVFIDPDSGVILSQRGDGIEIERFIQIEKIVHVPGLNVMMNGSETDV